MQAPARMTAVLVLVLKAITGRFWNGDLLEVYDGVAKGVVQELDFRHEAANAAEFKASLSWLGYVDVPVTLPELTTRRAMAIRMVCTWTTTAKCRFTAIGSSTPSVST